MRYSVPARVASKSATEMLVYRTSCSTGQGDFRTFEGTSDRSTGGTSHVLAADVKNMCIEMQRQWRSAKGLSETGMGSSGMRGIWCSKEQWARIQRLLEDRLETVQDLRFGQVQLKAAHHQAIESGKLEAFAQEQRFMEQQGRNRMQVLEREACIAQLRDQLACAEQAHAEDTARLKAQMCLAEEHAVQIEQLHKERVAEKDEMADVKAELREANERCRLLAERSGALANELKTAKSAGWEAAQDAESKAANVAELQGQQAELRQRVEFYQMRLAERAVPSVELQQENTRLHADCKRLMALLETTSEYQHWVGREAALQGLHYMPIAECFASKGTLSDVYSPNVDRTVDLEVEEFHWVPKDAIKHMMALLGQFPQLTNGPFMAMLAELNKVWKQRETERIREVQMQHQKDLADFRRLHQQATPYQQSVMQHKLDHLKRELRASHQHARSLSKFKAKVSDQVADDSKSLLRWSLAQIDGLVDETKRLGQENALLWKHIGPQQAPQRSKVSQSSDFATTALVPGQADAEGLAGMKAQVGKVNTKSRGVSSIQGKASPGRASPGRAIRRAI
eukprot:jgi/Ulvmu1/5961/UM026_0084.1